LSKDKYKVVNWKQYTEGLKQRGSINIWISEEVLGQWRESSKTGKRGRAKSYSDSAILTCLTVRKVYHLALRQCEGFVSSFFGQLEISEDVPDYTTLCRRASSLTIALNQLKTDGITDIAVDSTGLKVYGEGEWKVRKHGYSKYRTWMKLHIGVAIATQQIEMIALTGNSVDDAEPVKGMLSGFGKDKRIKSFRGDGAYDKEKVRKQLWKEQIEQIIPPQHNAVKSKGDKPWLQSRDQTLEAIEQMDRKRWKQSVGYHKRSLSETTMYRYKTIIGDKLQCREPKNQLTEVKTGCRILNKMILLAKPISVKVA
jgi:IS5 family transposase